MSRTAGAGDEHWVRAQAEIILERIWEGVAC